MSDAADYIESVWPEWRVSKLIGRGGFGSVYRAERSAGDFSTEAAIKLIEFPSSQDEVDELRSMGNSDAEIRDYFRESAKGIANEIATMERMKGAPHVVHIEDFDMREKRDSIGWLILIRMELLESLKDYQRRCGTPDSREVARMGEQLCQALAACHAVGIIHRDVKPANVFVTRFGDYELGDFGIARRMEEGSTRSALTAIGTLAYAAPELMSGHYGSSVDTYSLGIMLYQYLNGGRPPFLPARGHVTQADAQVASGRRMGGDRPPLPAGDGVDSRLAAIVRRACEPNPADRWASVGDFGLALKSWLEHPTDGSDDWAQGRVAAYPQQTQGQGAQARTQQRRSQAQTSTQTRTVLQARPQTRSQGQSQAQSQAQVAPLTQSKPARRRSHMGALVGITIAVVLVSLGMALYALRILPNAGSVSAGGDSTGSASSGVDESSDTVTSSSDGIADELHVASDGTVKSSNYGYTLVLPVSFNSYANDNSGAVVFYDAQSDMTITLSGDNNPNGQSLDQAFQDAKESLGDDPYTSVGNNWFVVSDVEDNGTNVHYTMKYVESGRTATMLIVYPASQKSYADQMVQKIQPTFKLS